MRIMLCQTHILWENKEANFKRCEQLLKEANTQHVDLVCFPEMSFTGFSMNTAVTADHQERETLTLMKSLARQYHTSIAFGYVTMADGVAPDKAQNHYAVVNEYGDVLADYIKIHPFSYGGEKQFFIGGNTLCDFSFMGFHIGLAICYDLRFPEQFMALGQRCDMFIIGANWPQKRSEHWRTLLRARAIEQQCYVAAVNCFGEMDGIMYSGNSMMFSPDGTVLGEQLNEGYAIYDISNDVTKYRDDFPVRNDRVALDYFE